MALVRSGSCVVPPGSSERRSVKLDGCRCSIALRSMTDDVVMPCDSCAVTTTSFSMRLSCFNRSVRVAVSPFRLVYVCVSVW